jgi:hypothetical protein
MQLEGNGPAENTNAVTVPQTDADVLAFLSDEGVTGPAPGADAGGSDEGEKPEAAAADGKPAASPDGTEGDPKGAKEPTGEAPPPADYKAMWEKSERERKAALRELNENWAGRKREREAPAEQPDPAKDRLAHQRERLEKHQGFVGERLAEARKQFPNRSEDEHQAYAEHWGHEDYQDWLADRRIQESQEKNPYIQKLKQNERSERLDRLKSVLTEHDAIIKTPEINKTMFDVLTRKARELEHVERAPGRYVTPDGKFTADFETSERVEEIVNEALDIAIGRANRGKVKGAVAEAYEKGKASERGAQEKKRVRTVVPVGTGGGARLSAGSGGLDSLNQSIINARG